MWAKQHLSIHDIDYAVWERDKSLLHKMARVSRNCTFVVDVYKNKYVYASPHFANLLCYDEDKIATLEKQGDYLESRFHPDDFDQLVDLQIKLGQFIYNLPVEQRNDYCNIYSFRVRNAKQQYVRVTNKVQVLEQGRAGKAWLILGNMSISPDQKDSGQVACTVLNLKSGELFSPTLLFSPTIHLTERETAILHLIQKGLLSKEIAHKLQISIHTVNIHRQNLLHKLEVQNSIEAINKGIELGILK